MLPSRIFFDHFFDDFDSTRKLDRMMKCDIYEQEGKYILELDVPGYQKEDLYLELEDGYLKIFVEKTDDESKTEEKKYLHRERHMHERYERQFYIGNVNEEEIEASFKDGILKITIPKAKQKVETKKTIMIED